MKYLTNLDLNKNELQNARVQNLASAPGSPVEGQLYHNTTNHKTYLFNGTAWIDITSALDKVDGVNAVINTSAKIISPTTKALGSASVDVFRVESATAEDLLAVKQNGDTVVGGKLTINGSGISTGAATDLTLSGNLAVQGSTTLGDDASADKTTIKGITKIISKATKAAGSSSIDVFRVESSDAQGLLQVRENGDTVIGGVLTVSGTGTSTFAGDVSIGGKLTVADTATATADLSGTNLTLTGNLVVQGNSTLGNEVTDTAQIQGILDLSNANFAGIKYDGTAARITAAEIGYLDGVTSAVQTQINAKYATSDMVSGNTASKGVLRDASGNFAANQITATKVTGLSTPSADSDAANKAYVDAMKMGFDYKDSVRVATTANITLSGTQTIDGVAVMAGNRVLVKDQTAAATNGIYVAASGAWARAVDADSSAEVTSGMYVFVSEGTAQGKTAWVLSTADPITLGTTALTFTQFSGAGTYSAGSGITLTGNQFAITSHAGTAGAVGTVVAGSGTLGVSLGTTSTTAAAGNHIHDDRYYTETELGSTTDNSSGADKIGSTAITGVTGTTVQSQLESIKTLIDGKQAAITTLPVANGGTGATTAAVARGNLGATGRYAANVGDGSATSITVTHNLATMDVVVSVRDAASPYNGVMCDWQVVDANSIKLLFAAAPASGAYRVAVIG